MKRNTIIDLAVLCLVSAFAFGGFLFLREFFQHDIDDFSTNIIAAVMGATFTVACMAVLMRMQARQDKEKEFSSKLFEEKLAIYEKLLESIFKMDDDNLIEEHEVQEVENQIGVASLVAGRELVSTFSQFLVQLKTYGCLYSRSMRGKQVVHFVEMVNAAKARRGERGDASDRQGYLSLIKRKRLFLAGAISEENFNRFFVSLDDLVQGIRQDLAVVDGNIEDMLEQFVQLPYDSFKLIRDPNTID